MTRSCIALIQGDWAMAWRHQPFAFPLVLLAAAFASCADQTKKTWKRLPTPSRNLILLVTLLLCLSRWVFLIM
ncbi:MAG: hypothetical protein ACI97A_003206 [Planctomycetota bacterium]|jgi:hypothetical protein